jgi:hypothetical protein
MQNCPLKTVSAFPTGSAEATSASSKTIMEFCHRVPSQTVFMCLPGAADRPVPFEGPGEAHYRGRLAHPQEKRNLQDHFKNRLTTPQDPPLRHNVRHDTTMACATRAGSLMTVAHPAASAGENDR